jgi:integrase
MGMTYQRGAVWWVKYYRNGRPIRESSGSPKESDAINLLKIREGDIAHGLPVNPKLNRIRFDEAAEDLKTEYAVNGRRSADELERRIRLHLLPYFGGRCLAMISTANVNAFILKRQMDVMIVGDDDDRQERKYSNGEINRELTTLKRILNLARQNGKLMHVPYVPMLKERNVRTGFFEREQFGRILGHLPAAIRPAVQFGYITGWRIPSEVLRLQWRHVDFEARVVRLDPHTTKNDEGRTFPFTDALEQLLEAQKAEHDRLKAKDVICPWVFNRSNRKVKGKRITTFLKTFRTACTKAGCPGRIPHDLRRTAVRNLVRAGVPERVAMQLTGHKTRSVFERYNIVSECDLLEAAKKLNAIQPASLPPAFDVAQAREGGSHTSDRDGLAATKPRSGEVGHNLGTVRPDRGSRRRVSLSIP